MNRSNPQDYIAIFSDVHSNLHALTAVLADMHQEGIKNKVCLGDVVGYGANPKECLEIVRKFNCPILLGNHDEAVSVEGKMDRFRDHAKEGAVHSRRELTENQLDFLRTLPLTDTDRDMSFVHASLHEPSQWHYVINSQSAEDHFHRQPTPYAFCGHSHIPAIFEQCDLDTVQYYPGTDLYEVSDRIFSEMNPLGYKYLVNVGSVGQPRDHDPRACYVLFNTREKTIEFRRVEYDIAGAAQAIRKAGLPEFLARRLSEGK
ncbi:MAG: metallophosphoesterase family protein [Verrucomicrobiae bacterium]|nr:metallophosphoesterase family protein [Verrucomicrobiae bacterium]